MRALFLFLVSLISSSIAAMDTEFLRAWEAAQKERPARIQSIGTIADPSERGVPLTIRGEVLNPAGAAAPGAVVFAWQTDAKGAYDRRGAPAHSWRLRGWVRTDARGAFTFHTIRPAAYPNGREPAHVHFTVETADGRRYFVDDLHFADDPLPKGEAEAAAVTTRNGRQHVAITLHIVETNRF
jgi:protocatechuate 3,4-dioxygenase beta subunit